MCLFVIIQWTRSGSWVTFVVGKVIFSLDQLSDLVYCMALSRLGGRNSAGWCCPWVQKCVEQHLENIALYWIPHFWKIEIENQFFTVNGGMWCLCPQISAVLPGKDVETLSCATKKRLFLPGVWCFRGNKKLWILFHFCKAKECEIENGELEIMPLWE